MFEEREVNSLFNAERNACVSVTGHPSILPGELVIRGVFFSGINSPPQNATKTNRSHRYLGRLSVPQTSRSAVSQ